MAWGPLDLDILKSGFSQLPDTYLLLLSPAGQTHAKPFKARDIALMRNQGLILVQYGVFIPEWLEPGYY